MQAYVPPRTLAGKLRRRLTQAHLSKPAHLRFDAPLLSIAFDDFPASAAEVGARIMEAHGARGTYYTAAGLIESDGPCGRNFAESDLRRLISEGHELGCHGYAHRDAAQNDVFTVLQDLAKNRDALMNIGAPSPRTHAYPYGETTTRVKDGLPPRFSSARGAAPGLNLGRSDLAQLRACPMFGAGWELQLRRALKRAAKCKAWLIAFTHDINDAPSRWGARGGDLDALLGQARRLGFAVLPVTAALERRLA